MSLSPLAKRSLGMLSAACLSTAAFMPAFAQEAPKPGALSKPKPTTATSKPKPGSANPADKYDFAQVVSKYKESMDPLNQEMKTTFKNLESSFAQAQKLMDENKIQESLQTSSEAIEEIVAIKDKVLTPLRENRTYLMKQTQQVNIRLAEALSQKRTQEKADPNAIPEKYKKMLTTLAQQVQKTKDPQRKADLYRRFKKMQALVTKARPRGSKTDPTKLWAAIYSALNKAKQTQLTVIRNTEDMFANFEFAHAELSLQAEAAAAAKNVEDLIKALGGEDGNYENTIGGQIKKLSEMQKSIGSFTDAMSTNIETTMKTLETTSQVSDPDSPLYQAPVNLAEIENDPAIKALLGG